MTAEEFAEEMVQIEYEDAVHTNFHVPIETVVHRVALKSFQQGQELLSKRIIELQQDKNNLLNTIAKMRCCGNCGHHFFCDLNDRMMKLCDEWRLAENVRDE